MTALEKLAWAAEQAHNGPPHSLNIDYIAIARAVISSIEVDDAMVEVAARTAYDEWIRDVRDLEPAWDELPQSHRDRMFACQRAALTASLRSILEDGAGR